MHPLNITRSSSRRSRTPRVHYARQHEEQPARRVPPSLLLIRAFFVGVLTSRIVPRAGPQLRALHQR